MNYLHFDSKGLYFLVKPLTLDSTVDFAFGLFLTGGICVAERVITSRLEKTSMTLYQLQQQKPIRKILHNNNNERNIPLANSDPRQSISSSSPNQTLQDNNTHNTSSRTRTTSFTSSHGKQNKSKRIRNAMIQKAILYAIVNALRLSYMLLAMSFHIGILVVIIGSLTGSQLCLDIAQVYGTRSEYEPLGSSEGEDTRASEERLPWYFEEEESVQRTESGIQLQHNVATTRSLDCV